MNTMNTMNISICNACRSIDVGGSIRLFDTRLVKELVSSAFPGASVSIHRTEAEDDEEYVVVSIEGRVVTASDENELRAIETRVHQIIREYEASMKC